MVILQGGVLRRIPNHKQMRTIYFTMTLIMPAYFILAISLSTLFFGMGLFLYSFASAFVVPCLTSLVAELCTDGDKGTTMGVFRSLGALARAFGPVFSSIVFWALGPTTCYCIGGILFIIPLVVLRSYSSSTYQCVTKKNQPENSTIKLETSDNKDTTD
uniref:MFS domain-containing protein n=1 Tax=Rhabditophanes sp. KR3021 TaxID=114890 RepID=A0AC35U5U6_9BILA